MPPRATRILRLTAGFDLVITGLFALPFTAPVFVDTLYALDRALGGPFATPNLGALGWSRALGARALVTHRSALARSGVAWWRR